MNSDVNARLDDLKKKLGIQDDEQLVIAIGCSFPALRTWREGRCLPGRFYRRKIEELEKTFEKKKKGG